MDFRIRQLEYFLVLAEKLNFGRAAKVLNVAQPTLSFQIKALESTFGAALFDRTQRQVRLTPAGQRLRDHARKILNSAQEAMHAIEDSDDDPLTVGCGAVCQYTLLPEVLRELRARHPELAVTIQPLTPEKMKQAAINRTADVLLLTPKWELPRMQFIPLRAERLWAVLPANHPAARRGWTTIEEFCQNRILVASAKDCSNDLRFVTNLLDKYGLTPELVESPLTGEFQFVMVAAGCGVALAAESMSWVNFPGIQVVPFDHVVHNIELGMMWHKDHEPRSLAVFREVVERIVQSENEFMARYGNSRASTEHVSASHGTLV